ncbi:MAG: hypothetical protein GXO27_06995 [Chlorobi bacterium]|nr:hypothetical protein [Chlorobiota bacterium]
MNTLRLPLFDKNFGKEAPLTWRDRMLIRRREFIPYLYGNPAFKHMIVDSPFCPHPFGMREFHLINTDPEHDYKVTLRLTWEQGTRRGEAYVTLVSRAGSKIYLGCEAAPTLPVLRRKWEVVAETVISTCWV